MFTLVVLLFTSVLILYLYVKYAFSFWSSRGVPSPKPLFLIGNIWPSIVGRRHIGQIVTELYNKYSKYKYVGFYKFLRPAIIIRDPDLVRNVMIKDFEYFDANDQEIDETKDEILGKNPFSLRGHMWKVVRAQLTPNFTAGRVKAMFPLMDGVTRELVEYLKKKVKNNDANCMEAKELAVRFTTENVALCAFGLDGQAFVNENSEFIHLAKDFGHLSVLTNTKYFTLMLPSLAKMLNVKFLSDFAESYLTNVVKQTLKHREENNITRNDFLDAMKLHKQKCKEYNFTDMDIIGQVAGFFGDSVETSGSVLSYVLYRMGLHPDIQDRLLEEIETVLKKHNGVLSYEAVQEMNYLNCIFDETLRLHSVDFFYIKRCTRSYKLPPAEEGGKEVTLTPGMSVFIPVDALHYDEEHFPDALTFNPDRFSDENKESIVKGTYVPFGEGPRICLGMRFGTFQVKIAAIAIVRNFVVKLNKRTNVPLKTDKQWLLRNVEGGIWIALENREKK